MKKVTYNKIEYYLYNYQTIAKRIEDLKANICYGDYNQTYKRWIKTKSSGVQEQIIKNEKINQRIIKLNQWKELISHILAEYQTKDEIKYKFIVMKYFNNEKDYKIQEKLKINYENEMDIQNEIVEYIFFCAKQKKILEK